jgi:tRNA threonylcarbamoyl adenosine modification protein YeaZ
MQSRDITLGIEAGINGGTLALFVGRTERAVSADLAVAKAENILLALERLLRAQGVAQADISAVAVSAGPGSFTGIRIGLATALGLGRGLGVPIMQVSLLHAMAWASDIEGDLTCVVPVGRGMICTQRLRKGSDYLEELGPPTAVHEQSVLGAHPSEIVITVDTVKRSLASCICLAALHANSDKNVSPIFVSKPAIQ